jgi:hypothetical protein
LPGPISFLNRLDGWREGNVAGNDAAHGSP